MIKLTKEIVRESTTMLNEFEEYRDGRAMAELAAELSGQKFEVLAYAQVMLDNLYPDHNMSETFSIVLGMWLGSRHDKTV